jgi:hypothetical protein
MSRSAIFRVWVQNNFALIAFLAAYAALTVLGNITYLFPLGEYLVSSSISNFRLSQFPLAHSIGYWLLLFCPFFVVPPVAYAIRFTLSGVVRPISAEIRDFRRLDYIIILFVCYGYVIYAFWRIDVLDLIAAPQDAFESVYMRFEILESLGFWPQMVLKSILIFLSVYSFVRALRERESFWIAFALINLVLLSVLLFLLNQKWPVLIFYVALTSCSFLYSRKYPYLNTALSTIGLVIAYVAISLVILRLVPVSKPVIGIAAVTKELKTRVQLRAQEQREIMKTSEIAGEIVEGSIKYTPLLIGKVLNRMAMAYPYYYQLFTEEGQICGTILDRIQRKTNPCHPSSLIHNRIWGDLGFEGKATAPAAVHISGYALGGWPGAFIELLLASIIIGIFISLPSGASTSATIATAAVVGGITSYFFSQLPVEGPIVYDHGILWWSALVVGYAIFDRFRIRDSSS